MIFYTVTKNAKKMLIKSDKDSFRHPKIVKRIRKGAALRGVIVEEITPDSLIAVGGIAKEC
ncbi:hypothetical protein [Xenorhabdus sp. PB62.4]|uniref:hypothetical protein n=1 Tax=Xenorhabdus sp. PB62.4 TaxID=1851573 RepID=UPI001CA3FBA2|nr:hypothetical protein [Xenorhabdus sp. PB62.4]MBC8954345.1 hypothetical protein [Xenorhabdus sp. PB62.4]